MDRYYGDLTEMGISMEHAVIEKYAAPVPRYTSYPTAPHF